MMAVNTCKRCGHEFFIVDEMADTSLGNLCLDCERELTAEAEYEHEKDRERWASEHGFEFDSGFDGLTLCPRCGGAETRYGSLCLVCQREVQADNG